MDGQLTDRRQGADRRASDDRRRLPDRRSGLERRQNVSDRVQTGAILRLPGMAPFVERRSGRDRRSGADSRLGFDRRSGIDRRIAADWRGTDLGNRLTPESALELVSDFYSASMDNRFWPTALSKLRETLDATAFALAVHDASTDTGSLPHAVGIDVGEIQAYGEVYARNHPWLQQEHAFRIPGTVYRDVDLVNAAEATDSDFVRHWLAPQGLAHQMFGLLDRQGHRILFLYAVRSEAAGAFSDTEVALLRRLLPYLQRGLRAGQLLQRTQAVRQVAQDALDSVPVGVIIVGVGGAVLGVNRVGREVMTARDVFSLGRGGLELSRDGRRTLVRDVVAELLRGRSGNRPSSQLSFSVARPSGQRPLSVTIMPVTDLGPASSPEEPGAILFLGDPDRTGEIDEPRLRQLYGLTAAEARVAALLARGYRLDEIAELLGVAYETTRKHLKKVLAKIETDRQADLVRTIVTGPGGLRR